MVGAAAGSEAARSVSHLLLVRGSRSEPGPELLDRRAGRRVGILLLRAAWEGVAVGRRALVLVGLLPCVWPRRRVGRPWAGVGFRDESVGAVRSPAELRPPSVESCAAELRFATPTIAARAGCIGPLDMHAAGAPPARPTSSPAELRRTRTRRADGEGRGEFAHVLRGRLGGFPATHAIDAERVQERSGLFASRSTVGADREGD